MTFTFVKGRVEGMMESSNMAGFEATTCLVTDALPLLQRVLFFDAVKMQNNERNATLLMSHLPIFETPHPLKCRSC